MAIKAATPTSKPWDSTPTRGPSTRHVTHGTKAHAPEAIRDRVRSTEADELPPPGPPNIMVTTANPLPAPKTIGSKQR